MTYLDSWSDGLCRFIHMDLSTRINSMLHSINSSCRFPTCPIGGASPRKCAKPWWRITTPAMATVSWRGSAVWSKLITGRPITRGSPWAPLIAESSPAQFPGKLCIIRNEHRRYWHNVKLSLSLIIAHLFGCCLHLPNYEHEEIRTFKRKLRAKSRLFSLLVGYTMLAQPLYSTYPSGGNRQKKIVARKSALTFSHITFAVELTDNLAANTVSCSIKQLKEFE